LSVFMQIILAKFMQAL